MPLAQVLTAPQRLAPALDGLGLPAFFGERRRDVFQFAQGAGLVAHLDARARRVDPYVRRRTERRINRRAVVVDDRAAGGRNFGDLRWCRRDGHELRRLGARRRRSARIKVTVDGRAAEVDALGDLVGRRVRARLRARLGQRQRRHIGPDVEGRAPAGRAVHRHEEGIAGAQLNDCSQPRRSIIYSLSESSPFSGRGADESYAEKL